MRDEPQMHAACGVLFVLGGFLLIATRRLNAQILARLHSKYRWTRWATGEKWMWANRVSNLAIGTICIAVGVFVLVHLAVSCP